MTYAQALEALEARQEAVVSLGLSRVRRHLRRLGEPQKNLACLHVAGTNGKGSVCAILESVLRRAGYSTGLYTSPHLSNVRERIRVAGQAISEADFARLLARALAADRGNDLTYFELLTSVAFQHFARKRVDVAVLETGLGGRLDATNVVEKPLASVITSIDFDHMNFLGTTLAEIAAEKAGIIKPGRPVFCPALPRAAMKAVAARSRALRAPLGVVRRPFGIARTHWPENRQTLITEEGLRFDLSLLGDRQARNAALARAVLAGVSRSLPVPETAWSQGLSSTVWPGRFEVRRLGAKTAILDGAHNPEAIRNFRRTWQASPFCRGRVRWIIGIMRDKDAARMLRVLAPFLGEVVTVRPPSPRALDALELAREVRRLAPSARVSVESDCETAARAWLEGGRGAPPVAVFCGSFYLVGRAAKALGAWRPRARPAAG